MTFRLNRLEVHTEMASRTRWWEPTTALLIGDGHLAVRTRLGDYMEQEPLAGGAILSDRELREAIALRVRSVVPPDKLAGVRTLVNRTGRLVTAVEVRVLLRGSCAHRRFPEFTTSLRVVIVGGACVGRGFSRVGCVCNGCNSAKTDNLFMSVDLSLGILTWYGESEMLDAAVSNGS